MCYKNWNIFSTISSSELTKKRNFGEMGFTGVSKTFWIILILIWFEPQLNYLLKHRYFKSLKIWIIIFGQNSVIQAILFWVALESENVPLIPSTTTYTWLTCLIYLLDLEQCQDILEDIYLTEVAWGIKSAMSTKFEL